MMERWGESMLTQGMQPLFLNYFPQALIQRINGIAGTPNPCSKTPGNEFLTLQMDRQIFYL